MSNSYLEYPNEDDTYDKGYKDGYESAKLDCEEAGYFSEGMLSVEDGLNEEIDDLNREVGALREDLITAAKIQLDLSAESASLYKRLSLYEHPDHNLHALTKVATTAHLWCEAHSAYARAENEDRNKYRLLFYKAKDAYHAALKEAEVPGG